MSKTFRQREEKIADLEWQLNQLREEQAKFLALSDAERLAIELHDTLCHSNHIDQCDWGYDNSSAKAKYFGKAKSLIEICNSNSMPIVEAIRLLNIAVGP